MGRKLARPWGFWQRFEAATTQKRTESNYGMLRLEQKKLVDDYVQRYNSTTRSKISPQDAYDNARMSVRTTFDAVTSGTQASAATTIAIAA